MGSCGSRLIEADSVVLVLIDVQERLAAVMDDRERVITAAGKLARAAALVGAPILVTRQYPKGLGPVAEGLQELLLGLAHEGAHVIGVDKTTFCCNGEPEFEGALAATGRDQILIAGMETHICVTQTALASHEAGKRVHVAADACCSREALAHETALARLRAAGVEVTHSESAMYEMVGVAGTDEFRSLLGIVKD